VWVLASSIGFCPAPLFSIAVHQAFWYVSFCTLSSLVTLDLPALPVPSGFLHGDVSFALVGCHSHLSFPSLTGIALNVFKLAQSSYTWMWESPVAPLQRVPAFRMWNLLFIVDRSAYIEEGSGAWFLETLKYWAILPLTVMNLGHTCPEAWRCQPYLLATWSCALEFSFDSVALNKPRNKNRVGPYNLDSPYIQYFLVPVLSFPKTLETLNDSQNVGDTLKWIVVKVLGILDMWIAGSIRAFAKQLKVFTHHWEHFRATSLTAEYTQVPLYSGCGAINRTSAKRSLVEYVAIKSRFKLFKNSMPCSAYPMKIAVSLGLAFMEIEK
jgi:hypothetical protein